MTVPIICLTNGRPDCIAKTIPSAIDHLTGVSDMVIVDDSGDETYGHWLEDEYLGGPFNTSVLHITGQHGYWRAMKMVWDLARHFYGSFQTEAFFFLEDDFVFNEAIDLTALARVLAERPYLTQMALLRQPWWPNEHQHGGLIGALEAQGQVFTERTDGTHRWMEHRACFTGNPSLVPRRTFQQDWPEGAWSESRFAKNLFTDPQARGAYWGKRTDPPRVEHIGHHRAGTDY